MREKASSTLTYFKDYYSLSISEFRLGLHWSSCGADLSTMSCKFLEYLPSTNPIRWTLCIGKGFVWNRPIKYPLSFSSLISLVTILALMGPLVDNKLRHTRVMVGGFLIPVWKPRIMYEVILVSGWSNNVAFSVSMFTGDGLASGHLSYFQFFDVLAGWHWYLGWFLLPVKQMCRNLWFGGCILPLS